MTANPSVIRFEESALKMLDENRMVVFLCGPSLKIDSASSKLRQRLKDELEKRKFEVVLGEDDGLEEVRLNILNGYAHSNELDFINKECGAIVLIADSIGSFCELGLFAHEHALQKDKQRDFILIANKKFEKDTSYFSEGPAKVIADYGLLTYVDFETAAIDPFIQRLERRRSVYFLDNRGRPAK